MRTKARLCLALVLAACGSPPASAQVRPLDPAWLTPTTTPSCLPYGTGAIQQATHVGSDAIAITRTLTPLRTTGYDGMDNVYTLELRSTHDLSLIWSRALTSPPSAISANSDGSRVVIGTYTSTDVFERATAAHVFSIPGAVHALAFGPSGELAISHGSSVDVVDRAGVVQRTITITGMAPTVMHAMELSGECHEIFTETEALATMLAFARDGTLIASVSDGSVRALGADDAQRWTRPPERSWGYRTRAVAFEPISATAIRALYGDGFSVTLRTPTLTEGGTHTTTCSSSELAIATRRLGASAVAEPPTCAVAGAVDVDASGRRLIVAPITRAYASSGGSLLTAPTLRNDAGLLVGDEAWLFGVDGTGERWSLGAGGGTFGGALAIPGRTGWVHDVSADGRWVAFGTREVEAHGSEDLSGGAIHIADMRSETLLPAIGGFGARIRFVPGMPRAAIELLDHGHRAVEIRELPGGARVRRVELADAEYGGLVAVDARRVVVSEGPHVRVVDIASGSERAIDLPPCAIEQASLVGDRLAMRVYDQTTTDIGHYRIEVLDLAGTTLTSLARVEGGGHDVQLVDAGAAAIYADAHGVAQRLDVATGTATPIAGLGSPVMGLVVTRHGTVRAERGIAGSQLWLDGIQTSTTILDWTRGAEHPGAAMVYELGGIAYVIGFDGRTRGAIHAVDGGVVVHTPSGAFSVTPEARGALAVRDGDVLRACDASMEAQHVPGLLEVLVR